MPRNMKLNQVLEKGQNYPHDVINNFLGDYNYSTQVATSFVANEIN